mgnify:CR=1 FL=1
MLNPISLRLTTPSGDLVREVLLAPGDAFLVGRSGTSERTPHMLEKYGVDPRRLQRHIDNSRHVSAEHLLFFRRQDGALFVVDLDSRNGTKGPLPAERPMEATHRALYQLPSTNQIHVDYGEPRARSSERESKPTSAIDLLKKIRSRLGQAADYVRLVNDSELEAPLPKESERFRLHGSGQSLLVQWSTLTCAWEDLQWLQQQISLFNARLAAPKHIASNGAPWDFVARSPGRTALLEELQFIAPSTMPILLYGPSGGGKTHIARQIHEHSLVANARFVSLHLQAVTETLLESELFGHAKGAFSGAISEQEGYVDWAQGGTLFLDEIDKVPMSIQQKLLSLLDDVAWYRRVGCKIQRPSNCRIIAASNRNLRELVAKGEFSGPLYWRLNGCCLRVPELGMDDLDALIPQLLLRILHQEAGRLGSPLNFDPLAPEELQALSQLAARLPLKEGGVRSLSKAIWLYLLYRSKGRSSEVAAQKALSCGPAAMESAGLVPRPTSVPDPEGTERASATTPPQAALESPPFAEKDGLRLFTNQFSELIFLQEALRYLDRPEPGTHMVKMLAQAFNITTTAVNMRLKPDDGRPPLRTRDDIENQIERLSAQLRPHIGRLQCALSRVLV